MNRAFSRPIFWPLVLIAVGVLWLLGNFGVISPGNLWALTRLWPFLLIGIGLDLIARQRWPWAGNLIALVLVIAAVLVIVFAGSLGLAATGGSWFGPFPFVWGGQPGSGNVVTEARSVSDFEAVTFNSFGELTIQQGEPESLTIEAEDNVLPEISTEVRGGRLYIESSGDGWFRVRPTRAIRFTLTVRQLNAFALAGAGSVVVKKLETGDLDLVLSGAGSLDCEDLRADEVTLRLSGAGSLKAAGQVDRLDANLSGVGSFSGGDLQSETAEVIISGLGSAEVWVTRELDARINGLGSVNYYGSPQVKERVSGLGSVGRLGDK